ncbi:MAG: PIN domain-containing protein [Acidobacteriota bacterium]
MTSCVVLDSEAMSALSGPKGTRNTEVRAALRAASRLRREVLVPAVVLAELYRGRGHNQLVDACLSRETGIAATPTDRKLARIVGAVLTAAGAGSEMLADAHVVAAAVESGGGLILTGDPSDMEQLAAPFRSVLVAKI